METIKKILCLLLILPISFSGFSKTIKVKMLNNRFDPAAISIHEGDTILWSNLSGNAMELVTGSQCKADGIINSGSIIHGNQFQYVFSKQGNYTYFNPTQCSEGMRGLVMVNPKRAEPGKAKSLDQSQQKKSSLYELQEEVLYKTGNHKWRTHCKNVLALKPKEFMV